MGVWRQKKKSYTAGHYHALSKANILSKMRTLGIEEMQTVTSLESLGNFQ